MARNTHTFSPSLQKSISTEDVTMTIHRIASHRIHTGNIDTHNRFIRSHRYFPFRSVLFYTNLQFFSSSSSSSSIEQSHDTMTEVQTRKKLQHLTIAVNILNKLLNKIGKKNSCGFSNIIFIEFGGPLRVHCNKMVFYKMWIHKRRNKKPVESNESKKKKKTNGIKAFWWLKFDFHRIISSIIKPHKENATNNGIIHWIEAANVIYSAERRREKKKKKNTVVIPEGRIKFDSIKNIVQLHVTYYI